MINTVNFDKIRYIELLQEEEILRSQTIYIPSENYDELLSYKIILANQVYSNQKDKYIYLIEEYLVENASIEGIRLFVWKFFIMFRKTNEVLDILEREILEQGIERLNTFFINPNSIEFSILIDQIFDYCDSVPFDPNSTTELNPDKFREWIKETFFEMQKYIDK